MNAPSAFERMSETWKVRLMPGMVACAISIKIPKTMQPLQTMPRLLHGCWRSPHANKADAANMRYEKAWMAKSYAWMSLETFASRYSRGHSDMKSIHPTAMAKRGLRRRVGKGKDFMGNGILWDWTDQTDQTDPSDL